MKEGNLDKWRGQLDEIDRELVELLGRRFEITRKIGVHKHQNGLPVVDEEREAQMLERIETLAKANKLKPGFVRMLLQAVLEQVAREHETAGEQR